VTKDRTGCPVRS